MKKYIILVVVFILVATTAAVAGNNPAWASLLPEALRPGNGAQPALDENRNAVFAPPAFITTITASGIYNIGAVCNLDVLFKVENISIVADAEIQHLDIEDVIFNGDPEENLLYPGCHILHYDPQGQVLAALDAANGTAKICFGASPLLDQKIYYFQENPTNGVRVWIPISSWLEDNERLLCAWAPYSGMYMPTGMLPPKEEFDTSDEYPLIPDGYGGSVLPPPDKITITSSGTYLVGGICMIRAKYNIPGLMDEVEVEYPDEHFTEDTLTVPSDAVEELFYFPGCHVVHYKDQVIKDEVFEPDEGEWEICFAAIPEKIMTIYYYPDNYTTILPPWTPLVTTTANGMACADLVDFTAVYVPAGK